MTAMTTLETIVWLGRHGIDTQIIGGQVKAKDVWMKKDGTVCEEWITVTCDLRWLRNWMNY